MTNKGRNQFENIQEQLQKMELFKQMLNSASAPNLNNASNNMNLNDNSVMQQNQILQAMFLQQQQFMQQQQFSNRFNLNNNMSKLFRFFIFDCMNFLLKKCVINF